MLRKASVAQLDEACRKPITCVPPPERGTAQLMSAPASQK